MYRLPAELVLPAVATGHLLSIAPPTEDIIARQREVKALVELRVPSELTRWAIDERSKAQKTPIGNRTRTQRKMASPKTGPCSMATLRRIFRASAKAPATRS